MSLLFLILSAFKIALKVSIRDKSKKSKTAIWQHFIEILVSGHTIAHFQAFRYMKKRKNIPEQTIKDNSQTK